MKINYQNLSALQLDALQEVGNIGAGHAATALSQIIGQLVMISVTRVNIVPVERIAWLIGSPQKKAVAIHFRLLGDMQGGIMLLLAYENALALADILKKNPPGATQELQEADISAFKELGGILSSAYLRAISDMTHLSLIPASSDCSTGEVGKVLKQVMAMLSQRVEIAFCIETEFLESTNKIKGNFLLIPEVSNLEILFKSLGFMVK